MSPVLWALVVLLGQQATPPPKDVEEPKEEDATLAAPVEYSFNPLKARDQVNIGNFYLKRGRFKAAADRFREATKWNPQMAEAFLKLGEAEEKNNDPKAAKEALEAYLKLEPDAKGAAEAKKRLKKLGSG